MNEPNKFAIQFWTDSRTGDMQFSSKYHENGKVYTNGNDMENFIHNHYESKTFANLFVGTQEEFDAMFPYQEEE